MVAPEPTLIVLVSPLIVIEDEPTVSIPVILVSPCTSKAYTELAVVVAIPTFVMV